MGYDVEAGLVRALEGLPALGSRSLGSLRSALLRAYQSGHREGQEAMRERAAGLVDVVTDDFVERYDHETESAAIDAVQTCGVELVCAINKLPTLDPRGGEGG